jgi:hypothetical protein
MLSLDLNRNESTTDEQGTHPARDQEDRQRKRRGALRQAQTQAMTDKNDKPTVNFVVLQSVEDYVEKSGKFRTNCASFKIPGRDSGGANTVYIPYCEKQRFDFGQQLNDYRGLGVFKPPEMGKPWEIPDFNLFVAGFHDIHCPQPCQGYRNKRVVALLKTLWPRAPMAGPRVPTAEKWIRKDTVILVVTVVLGLVTALLGWVTPEGRRLLHLDKPQPEQQTPRPSVPATMPQDFIPPPKPDAKVEPKSKVSGRKNVVGNSVVGDNNTIGNGNVSGSIVNNGGVINNPTINNAAPPKAGLFELTEERRNGFLKLLSAQTAPRDTVRIGCTSWSEKSCVAAGKFLLLFSEAGWQIEENKVFRMEPQIPIVGVAITTRAPTDESKEPLPPHLGRWRKMDESHQTIYWALRSIDIPVGAATDNTLKEGTLGIYFGSEPQ